MLGDTGCCGAGLKNDNTSLFGLVTLSFPLLIISAFIFFFLKIADIMKLKAPKLIKFIQAIIAANINIIYIASIWPKLRCCIAANIFVYSPLISGRVYKYFNLFFLAIFWALMLAMIFMIASKLRS